MTASNAAPPLGKYLASTDKKTRDKAIKNLSVFLSDDSRDAIPKADMAKLWKGIFYCFWMSDKPLVQQALASELAELVLTITTTSSSLAFLDVFWETIVREWNGIDRLRMDKYYMLVRRFVNASFRLLMRNEWNTKICQEYNKILVKEGGPLCPTDSRVPTSLAFHLADVYLEELNKVLQSPSCTRPVPLALIMSPFFNLSARTSSNTTYKHLQSSLLDPMLSCLSSPSDEPSEGDEPRSRKRIKLDTNAQDRYPQIASNSCLDDASIETKKPAAALRREILRRIFEIASQADTRDSNRRKMYTLWKEEKQDGNDEDE